MGPGGEGGGVHEVRRERRAQRAGDELVLSENELKSKTKRTVESKTIITSDNDSFCPQRCRLVLQNFSGVNSGQVFRDG